MTAVTDQCSKIRTLASPESARKVCRARFDSRTFPPNVFAPLDWQVAPWRDVSPILLLTGSAGGGKSRLAGEKAHAFCLRYPGAMALMVRKTRQSMVNSTVLFMERRVIGRLGGVRHVQGKNRFEYPNGSVLAYGGMADQEQREQIRSIGQDGAIDFCWMEEATLFRESDFNELRARMRGTAAPWRQILLTTNPDSPFHWINKRLLCGGEARVFLSAEHDNPYNPVDYADTLRSLTGIQKERLADGRWVQAEGTVYTEFRPETHVVERFEIPTDWERFLSVDFGFVNPFVAQWWARDGDGRMYLYRELYETERLVSDMAEEIQRLSKGEFLQRIVCDHDAEDRATLESRGLVSEAAMKSVRPGIQMVQRRLRKAGDGRPRLFLFRDALVHRDPKLEAKQKTCCTAEEFPGYVWDSERRAEDMQEQPKKDNDHGMDALRYMVAALDDEAGSMSLTT